MKDGATRCAWGVVLVVTMACGGSDAGELGAPTSSAPATSGTPHASALRHELGDAPSWTMTDVAHVGSGFAGAAFDGQFLYLVPGSNGIVVRYDDASSTTTSFDVTTVDSSAVAFRGAAFDGRYVYFAPYAHGDGSLGGTVARFDTRGRFEDAASWSTFDVSSVDARATGFVGVELDGRYLYLVPFGKDVATDGVVARYDTTASFTAPASWSTFDTATLDPNAVGFYGGTFDGRYLYLSPYADAIGSYSGRITRYDTTAPFTSPSSWTIFDTRSADPSAKGFFGATFDGRYAYFVPYRGAGSAASAIARYDTSSDFSDLAAWTFFDAAKLDTATDGVCPQGALFDGRYVYLVPSACASGASGLVARLDTQSTFTSPSAWSTFDTKRVSAGAVWFWGGAFDGEHVYLIPSEGTDMARLDARTPPSMPASYHGSFF